MAGCRSGAAQTAPATSRVPPRTPPYKAFEKLYGVSDPVAAECEAWARGNAGLRVALCGHRGDYDLPGWTEHEWDRGRLTYSGGETTAKECIWFSPACLSLVPAQSALFG